MKVILCAFTLFISLSVKSQDSLVTFTKVLYADSVSKKKIFDQALIWCSKSFNDSKSAIRVQERESGLIAGKAYYMSFYKIPKKKDSTDGLQFVNYYFDWLIEIKDGRFRFSVKNIFLKESDRDYVVSSSSSAPYEIWLQPKSKTDLNWVLSKKYLVYNLNKLAESLLLEVKNKSDSF